MNLESIARVLLIAGGALLVLGGIFFVAHKLGLSRLPGDLVFKGKNVVVYVPVGLMIVISVVGSLLLHFLSRR